MLGSIKAIIYRNFWLSYKMNLLSLIWIVGGIINALAFNLPISLIYCILVMVLHIQQQSMYTHLMVDDRFSGFKTTYHIMGLKRNRYIIGQSLSFVLQGMVINMLLFAVGMGYNYYKGRPVFPEIDQKLFLFGSAYLLTITFYSITISFMFRDPLLSKDLSLAFNALLFYFSIYLTVQNKLVFVQVISPYTYFLKFIISFILKLDDNIPPVTPYIYYLLIQSVGYFLIAVYLENVIGGEDDHNKHPLFFLDWFKSSNAKAENDQMANEIRNDALKADSAVIDKNGLSVFRLTKFFGKFRALHNISANFAPGKMHCMLGHNGAGKSTFINVLTGVYKADEGHILYMNESLIAMHKNESAKINVGICPPSDILFPTLTVYQHLKMMSFIKEIQNYDSQISQIMRQLSIDEYRDYKVNQLSGGNKRKLTIALSLIGNPNLLFLDEPTSSLDPVSRKDIWKILLSIKNLNRKMITILTTHHLEEAEALADNIVVLASGTIRVKGSIQNIKKAFGIGYAIEIVSKEPVAPKTFQDFIRNVNKSFGSSVLHTENVSISERKAEIKIPLSQIKGVRDLISIIKQNIPSNMFFTVNSNTLEKAYIEIDKDLHQDSKLNDSSYLSSVLERLHTNKLSSLSQQFLLIMNNKYQFLSNDFMEVFKIAAQYTIVASTMGLIVYFLDKKQLPLDDTTLSFFFGFMIFLEIVMLPFSMFNLVYDQSKELKFLIFINKVMPLTYYLAKLAVDFILVTIGYGILFAVLFNLLRSSLSDLPDGQALFWLYCFKVYSWKLSYTCVGVLYYRIFKTTKSAMTYFSLFYFFIHLVVSLIRSKFFDQILYLSDLSLIANIFPRTDISYLEIFVSFFTLSLAYILLAVLIEYRGLRYNYRNKRVEEKKYEEENYELNSVDAINVIQSRLKKSIKKEIEDTLSLQPHRLKVIDLKKQYNKSKIVLKEVTFNIDKSVQFGLIGPNGAGKSTLFNILLGKVFKTSGSIYISNMREYQGYFSYLFEASPYHFNRYGVCFQNDAYWEQLKVIENIRFFMQLHQVNEGALMELLEYFEFQHYLQKKASELSSGNKRKLCIILSLMINPNIVLYDEATCGVDLYMRLRLKNIFEHYRKANQSLAIFTTHFLKDIEVFCDKIGIIDRGQFLCIDYIEVIKQDLGGYAASLHFRDFSQKERVLNHLNQFAAVKVTSQHDDTKIIKCLFNTVSSILDIFSYLLTLEEEGVLDEFAINQLSIEDIYLDVFNRSE